MTSGIIKTKWVWRNGEFVPWEEAALHVMSNVVYFGSCILEGLRCYTTPEGPAIFRLHDHLRRLHDSCRIYRMEPEYSVGELADACRALVARNALEDCYLRPLAFRGYGAPGLDPRASPVEVFIITWAWGAYLGEGALEHGVDVCVSSWQRPAPNTFPMIAKAGGNYLNAQLMKMEAVTNGYAEAIAVGPQGLVSEGSGQNLFLVRDGTLVTPAVDGTLFPGITRASLLTLAGDLGIPAREDRVPRESLYLADEIFLCGTATEVTPVRSVDRMPVGDGSVGPVTRLLQRRFMEVVRGGVEDVHGWLTLVPEGAGQRPVHAARAVGTASVGD